MSDIHDLGIDDFKLEDPFAAAPAGEHVEPVAVEVSPVSDGLQTMGSSADPVTHVVATPPAATGGRRSRRTAGREGGGVDSERDRAAEDRALMKRAARRAIEFVEAPADARGMAAAALGVKNDDIPTMVAAAMSSSRSALAILASLDSMSDRERAIAVFAAGRRMHRAWFDVFSSLDMTKEKESLPIGDSRAAMRLLALHDSLTKEHRQRIAAAGALLA